MKRENLEKLYKRIEFSKVALKKKLSHNFPETGVYELSSEDYNRLSKILKLIDVYFKKHGCENWKMDDFDKLPSKLRTLFIDAYYKGLNRRIDGLSEQSKIFFMIDMESKKIKVDDRDIAIEYSDDIIKRWTKHTMIMVITGYLGKGKTDFSLTISEWGVKNKFMYVFHNIDMDVSGTDYDGIYHEVSRLSELLINIYKYKDKRKLFIMDEAGIHISHRTSMSSSNIIFMHLSKLLRKLKTDWILISQREGIDKEIREFATIWTNKENKNKAKVIELFDEEPHTYYITNIPKTSIKYDTNDVADFKIDIHVKDFDKIMEAIAKKVSFDEFRQVVEGCVKSENDDCNEYINKMPNEKENNKGILADIELSHSEKEILKIMYNSSEVSSKEISNNIKKSISQTSRYLKKLANWGFITITGRGNQTRYTITNIGIKYVESIKNVGK